ncbi:4-(cytidine 5'-diphospho)-2-C-methyl-D-erythritol kinase [Nostoc sp. NIES-2111]
MLLFPNIKLNLGLRITARRADGYHNLETAFLPVPGCGDALEAIPSPDGATRLKLSGIPIPGAEEDNLVLKAYHILNERYPLPPLHIYLRKAIPAGTGVGAGSSDAAFALKLFTRIGGHTVPEEELEELALQLGSDCPVFIRNRPAIGRGRGERLQPLELPLSGYGVRIYFPAVHVSTREAFAGITPKRPEEALEALLALPPEQWQGRLANDFEPGIFARHSELVALRDTLLAEGALYAAMSGSGSAVFGLFPPGQALSWDPGFQPGPTLCWQGRL